jgi:uncharacterized tellurite resistance protein B-like protein
MLHKLKALFAAPEDDPVALERRLQLAAAALLVELSKADYRRDEREHTAIVDAIRSCYSLDEDTIKTLLLEAEAASNSATSLYEFTSVINQNCSDAEKFALIRQLWRVAGADGNIDKYEDHLIRKVAELLYVPHQQFIRAKLEVLGNI